MLADCEKSALALQHSNGQGALNNPGQNVIGEMSQVLTVRSESLAAGFATGNNYTRTAERNRRLSIDERAPNVSLKLGLRFH
jgi:hypothetical protein